LARKVDSELALRMSFGSEWVPDVRSGHTERSLGCLSACPRHREAWSIVGPQETASLSNYTSFRRPEGRDYDEVKQEDMITYVAYTTPTVRMWATVLRSPQVAGSLQKLSRRARDYTRTVSDRDCWELPWALSTTWRVDVCWNAGVGRDVCRNMDVYWPVPTYIAVVRCSVASTCVRQCVV